MSRFPTRRKPCWIWSPRARAWQSAPIFAVRRWAAWVRTLRPIRCFPQLILLSIAWKADALPKHGWSGTTCMGSNNWAITMQADVCRSLRGLRVRVRQESVSGWERNSPKILGLIILLDKLNGVGGNSLPCDHLRKNARGDVDTTLVLH